MSVLFYIRKLLSPHQRGKLKKIIRKTKIAIDPRVKKQTKEDLYRLLTESFKIKHGDKLFVSSSFGNLCATDFTPQDLIHMLMEIVGPEGTIMMPFYPPLSSSAWAKSGISFDMTSTKSSMGVITNLFSKMPGVVKSMHPTKAVCVWGKDAGLFADDHYRETVTPFYCNSPYGKFLKAGSKSLALGIGRMPMVHCIEDIISTDPGELYSPEYAQLSIIKKNNEVIEIKTRVHDDEKMSKCLMPVSFLEKYKCPTFKKQRFGAGFCYIVENNAIETFMQQLLQQGITRLNG